jgi:hypothetical protein
LSSDSDETTVEESRSWLQRIGQSVLGVLFGLLLIVGAGVLLFWNEGRAVETARSLSEGAGVVLAVAAERADPANDGKLVHVSGALSTSGPANDAEFGVRSRGVRLARRVEMFQWTEESESETTKRVGGGETTRTTWRYKRAWADHPVDSSRFHDRNGHGNPQMTWRTRNIAAPGIRLGAFAVPESLYGRFGREQPLAAGDAQAEAVQKRSGKAAQIADGVLYVAQDPGQPVLGDYRITFSEVPLQSASIVARQAGTTFEPYRTRAGGTVELIEAGTVPAADMFKDAQAENRLWTWLIRAGGALLMFIGFCLVMGPIGVLADLIPILGDVVRAGTGVMALLLTVVLAPVVIAIAWFWYRPVVAVIVLAVGAVLAYGAIHWARARKPAAKAATAT